MTILVLVSVSAAALLVLGVRRSGWFVYGAIFTAPLNVYRRSLPDQIGPLHPPDVNLSLFRVCVLVAAVGLGVRLVRAFRARDAWLIAAARRIVPALVVTLAAVLWIGYESTRSLWGLGATSASAYAFFFLAVLVMALALLIEAVSPRVVLGVAAGSAVLPLLYACYQFVQPGTSVEKYNTPVLFSKIIDAPAHTDAVRAGSFRQGVFRPAATFSDYNFLAVFAAATVILADPGTWVTTPWRRWALHALRAVALLVVAVTSSRTGLIIVAAYLFFRYGPAVVRRFRRFAREHGPAKSAIVAVAASVVLGFGSVGVAVSRSAPASTSDHLRTVRQAVSLWREFPIDGAGLANFGYVFGQAPDRSSAQSFPFTILAEQGVIGLLLIALVVWGPGVRLALRGRGLEAAPLAVVFLVGAWFYDFPLALDVCAVWLAILIAAFEIPALRLPPAHLPLVGRGRWTRAGR